MSFLEELQGKRNALKNTEPSIREKENLEELIVKDEADYDRLMRETYFEEYYDHIEEFTFKSVIVPLTLEEIQAIHEAYLDAQVDLTSVEAKVEEGISTIKRKANKECQVFVRLSSRSPKDAIFHMEGFPELYQDQLAKIGDEGNLFSKLHAFYKASTDALRVTTAKQAVNLLRKSERIQGDLQTCLRTSEPMSLVVREFVSFPVKNELRGFVYKGRLTALTQYNNLAFFPEHLDSKAEIEAKVKSFAEGFIKAMESVLGSFIIDIVVDNNGKVWVVEVNPFGELAGSCLFRWSQDKAVLMGEKPFEFRIVEEPPSLGYIKTEIDERVLSIMGVK